MYKSLRFDKRLLFIRRLLTFACAIIGTTYATTTSSLANNDTDKYVPWAVYYSDKAPIETFKDYKLLILDSDYHPSLHALKDQGKLLLGYISLGEAESQRHYFKSLENKDILLQENKNWPGSYYVDVRKPYWTKLVIEELIPTILRKGFHGLFLDTLDNPVHLENTVDPKAYKGMTAAAIRLVRTIRRHYPDIPIMMNRGFDLLPDVENDITMVMAESFRTDQDPTTKIYKFTSEPDYQYILNILHTAQTKNPKLKIMTLDYWDPKDTEGMRKIYKLQRQNGFLPYVSTVDLHAVIPEPKP